MANFLLHNAEAVLALMSTLWVISVLRRDVSIVDPWWSMAFLLITARAIWETGLTPGKVLLLSLVVVWAVRLWLHLLLRSWGAPEDPRYAAFRERFGPRRYWWVSFFQVFLLQGALALVISAPLQLVAATANGVTWSEMLGGVVVLAGVAFEATADWQLQSFRRDPTRRGQVMNSGLWSWSRHPNYFGEAVLWWGFWICTLNFPWGWSTLFSPALMTFLLLRVSGVTLLDEHLRKSRPGYAEYIRRTSAFVPRRPRATGTQ